VASKSLLDVLLTKYMASIHLHSSISNLMRELMMMKFNFDKAYTAECDLKINQSVRFLERGRQEVSKGRATRHHFPT
jgi:hypothetical protein